MCGGAWITTRGAEPGSSSVMVTSAGARSHRSLLLLHRTLVVNGTKRHFAATQQSVALGGKADIGPRAPETTFLTPSRHLSKSSKFFAGGSLKLSAGGSGAPSASSSARDSADA